MSKYPDSFWLAQYLNIRLLEVGIKLNDERFEKEKSRIKQYYDYLGYEATVDYVNAFVKGYGSKLQTGSSFIYVPQNAFLSSNAVRPKITAKAKTIENTVS